MEKEKNKKALSENESEKISGGEVRQYRNVWTLFRRRWKVTNDMSGEVAIDGIKDFEEALRINRELNAHINKNINKKDH
ncbi:MAG: hypothetical protein IJJ04_00010 [Clostridia bacterium]|nr:hypothetical protein [Clostridia bacterium]